MLKNYDELIFVSVQRFNWTPPITSFKVKNTASNWKIKNKK